MVDFFIMNKYLILIFTSISTVLLIVGIVLLTNEVNFSSFPCYLSSKEISAIVNQDKNYNNNQTNSINFTGKYKLVKSENFDHFLERLGISFLQRTIANRATSEYEITKNEDLYSLKTISPFKTSEIKFKLNGEIFEERRLDGALVKSNMTVSGNKWIQRQFGEKEVKIVRQFNGDIIRVTAVVDNVASVRIYKRIK